MKNIRTIAAVILIISLTTLCLFSCDDQERKLDILKTYVNIIQNSSFEGYEQVKIGELLNSYYGSVAWSYAYYGDYGEYCVTATASEQSNADTWIYFRVDVDGDFTDLNPDWGLLDWQYDHQSLSSGEIKQKLDSIVSAVTYSVPSAG